jgi:hypothetical protein
MPQHSLSIKRLFLFSLSAYILIGSLVEFQRIAWGTGIWLGQLSLKWALALFFFGLFCSLCLIFIWMILYSPERLERISNFLLSIRDRLGPLRWIFFALFLILPVYFLQYTFWGKVLHGPYLRLLLVGFSSILLAWIFTQESTTFISWSALLSAFVLVSGTYILFVPLIKVTNYPFSLGWSEGNRLWDYSILFGRSLYDYPPNKPIPVFLETGRQLVGAIPFLFPDITIWQVRLWLALVDVIPYLILGWVAYRLTKNNLLRWMLVGIWAFTFVRQGPIHPPLLLCAIIVALVWERPLWLAVPLIAAASYFAEVTRFTWLFAPGMWAVMLELNSAVIQNHQLDKKAWGRAISVGAAGIFGGYAAPFLIPNILHWARSFGEPVSAAPVSATEAVVSQGIFIGLVFATLSLVTILIYLAKVGRWKLNIWQKLAIILPLLAFLVVGLVVSPSVTVAAVNASVSAQPLLWYRLFPNATYGEGILIGLVLATLPLIAILIYLARTGRWKLNMWQKLAIILPLLAFLVVGLIVSVKIGGGGDLHNMDMFIIGLMFAGAIAWRNGAFQWIDEIHLAPAWVQLMMVALIVIPAYKPLMQMRPISIKEDIQTVARLADIIEDPLPNPLPDTLPSEPDTLRALERLRETVATASQTGDVLFMDQRQLLTFGYIKDVPLVPEYDKKVLINEAMSENAQYFAGFYQDLASQRFSLIITSPVNRRLEKTEGHFGEENNAWVKWVTIPLLCYYEPLDRLKRVDIDLLVPRQDISTCDEVLPIQATE